MKKFVFCIILIAFFVSIFPYQGNALTASQVRDQIDETNKQKEILNKEIEKISNQIIEVGKDKNTLASTIKELTLTRNKLLKERDKIQININSTGLAIQNISSDIENKEGIIQISKNSLGKSIRELNQNDDLLPIERLLSVSNFSNFSRDYNNILSINEKVKDNIRILLNKKTELITDKTKKETEKEKLDVLKKDLARKEQVVAATKKEKDSLLLATKNKEAEFEKILAEQIIRKETFEKEIAAYEAQLKILINPKLLPSEGSEVLSWPLSYVLITSSFGSRWGSFHYGLDFRAAVGTSVKAMSDGIVIGTGNTDVACQGASFGRWVLIKYNNGLSSTYGHLSTIDVKKGDKIKNGQIIGTSGGAKGLFGSGSSTAQHLHISVYASDGVEISSIESKRCPGKMLVQPMIKRVGAHLNPILYLPKATADMYKK